MTENGTTRSPELHRRYGGYALVAVLAVTVALFLVTLGSVAAPVVLGMLLAAVTAPLRRALERRFGGRNVPAAIITTLVLLAALGPLAFVVTQVGVRVAELTADPSELTRFFASDGPWRAFLAEHPALARLMPRNFNDQVTAAFTWLGRALPSVLVGTLDLGLSFFITLLTVYYLLRDGRRIYERLEPVLPLEPRHTRALTDAFARAGRAILVGTLGAAAGQGAAAGLAYWALGLPEPLLWGTLTALLSLIPAVGSGLVWVPLGVFLILTGDAGKGFFLLGFGVLVVGSVDNVLRPLLARGQLALHPLLVFLGIFGGLATFGTAGIYIGPVFVALFAAVARIYARELAPATRRDSHSLAA